MIIRVSKTQKVFYMSFWRLMMLSMTVLFHSLLPTQVFALENSNALYRAQDDVLYSKYCNASSSGNGSGSGSTLSGDDNVSKAYNYLVSKGYSPAQAAGMVGNMMWESGGVNPKRLQGRSNPVVEAKDITAEELSSGSTGYGIVQWTPPQKMVNVVKAQGKDPGDLGVQLDFLYSQLNGGNESAANDTVKAANTPKDAAIAFEMAYERHAEDSSSVTRQMYAQAVYDKATKGTPYPPNVEAAIFKGGGSSTPSSNPASSSGAQPAANTSQSCGGGTTAEDNGECKDPFRDLKNSTPMRVDGGVDWGGDTGSGPVYAACPAEITLVQTTGSGWPGLESGPNGTGGAYIAYKVTSGKAKDKFIYISEDCRPKVAVGDKVDTNRAICDYQDNGTHLEIGWSEGGQNHYVGWSDYLSADNNNFASNSGLDFGKFMKSLGGQEGVTKDSSGISTVPPPADWPKWGSSSEVNV